MFPQSMPLGRGKPKSGTKLDRPDGSLNRSCKGAWLLGDGRPGNGSLWRDSSKSKLDATLYPASNGMFLERGRLGGVAYRSRPTANILSTSNYTPPTGSFTVTIFGYNYSWHNFSPLINQWNETGNKRSWGLIGFGDTHLYAYASSNGTNFRQYNTSSLSLGTREWFAVSAVFQASGSSILIYVNGVLQSTSTSGDQAYSGIFNTAQPIYIGYSPQFGGGVNAFEGRLEAASIDERILTADEIALLHRDQFVRWQREQRKPRYLAASAGGSSFGYPRTIVC